MGINLNMNKEFLRDTNAKKTMIRNCLKNVLNFDLHFFETGHFRRFGSNGSVPESSLLSSCIIRRDLDKVPLLDTAIDDGTIGCQLNTFSTVDFHILL